MTRRDATLLFVVVAFALARAGGAMACDDHANVRVELDPLPAALAGVRVEVHRTIGPQLVIENATAKTLEVLDDTGMPFLRIGPNGVEGNVNARALYTTYSPAAVPPAAAGSNEPRWQQVRSEPSFGWFESRVDPARAALPPSVIAEQRAADVGRWEIPLRLDGTPVLLAGRFRYEPPAAGVYSPRLTSPREVAPGVKVTLLPGQVPGLLVENATSRALLVMGAEGEPFLRIGPAGVEANVRSQTWRASARQHDRLASAGSDWQRVASVPRFSWVEPRAAQKQSEWQIPMRLGDDPLQVTGVTVWRPFDRD
jgi:hypothetical protein